MIVQIDLIANGCQFECYQEFPANTIDNAC